MSRFNVDDHVTIVGPPADLEPEDWDYLIGSVGVVVVVAPDGCVGERRDCGVKLRFLCSDGTPAHLWWYDVDLELADSAHMPEPDWSLDDIHKSQEMFDEVKGR